MFLKGPKELTVMEKRIKNLNQSNASKSPSARPMTESLNERSPHGKQFNVNNEDSRHIQSPPMMNSPRKASDAIENKSDQNNYMGAEISFNRISHKKKIEARHVQNSAVRKQTLSPM